MVVVVRVMTSGHYGETTDEQMLRLLIERRGELLYDLRRNRARETEIAGELTDTERAITKLEGKRLSDVNKDD